MDARINELLKKFREDSITTEEFCRLRSMVDASTDEELEDAFAGDWAEFARLDERRPGRLRPARIGAWAAAVLLPVFVATTVYFFMQLRRMDRAVSTFSSMSMQNYALTLPDGSSVTLGYGSDLSYNPAAYIRGERHVSFTGEAFFDVHPDAEHPFVVDAGGFDVVVRGTSFNLYTCPTDSFAELTLESGKVELVMADEVKSTVTPNQKAVINLKTGSVLVEECDDVKRVSAWKNGDIILQDASASEIANTVKRYYGVEIDIRSRHAWGDSVTFTGTLPTASLNEAMSILGLALDAEVSAR